MMLRVLLLFFFVSSSSFATTWTVDDDGKADFNNIQEAVDAASDGDEIVVMPGTYTSTQDGHVINMIGKAIWLHSSDGAGVTIVDGENIRRGIVCVNGETSKTVIEGFTFRNGYSTSYGAGMELDYASPTIENCVVMNCKLDGGNSSYGAGIYLDTSNATFTNCE
ncbi:MAG: hypothetical protein QF535_18835, partial [Anaerolineales bacterium]|nr:hypothetical protein [Anaerolineales bacterium]